MQPTHEKFLIVPVQLFSLSLKSCAETNKLKTFLWIKLKYGKKVEMYEDEKQLLCKDLNIKSIKTLNSHIETLDTQGWINFDRHGNLYPRGWATIAKKYSLNQRNR